MKYLRLVYSDEHLLHSLPESPADSECGAYAATLLGDGRLIAGEALHPVETASTVRVRRASEASRSDRCGNSISEPRRSFTANRYDTGTHSAERFLVPVAVLPKNGESVAVQQRHEFLWKGIT